MKKKDVRHGSAVAAALLLAAAAALGAGVTKVERISVSSAGSQGNGISSGPSLSGDGRFITFESEASNLVSNDINESNDVFVRDRATGTTERVSLSTAGIQGNDESFSAVISPDGRYVAFASFADNLVPGDTNFGGDVFVRDRMTGTTERVSVSSAGQQGNYDSFSPSISPDGRYVAFASYANNLVPGDTNGEEDIFVRDRVAGTTERVSVSTAGVQGNDFSQNAAISADGRYVAFMSAANNLVPRDTNDKWDIFVRDRVAGTTEQVSVSTAGAEGNDTSQTPSISADGRFVAFDSFSRNLVPGLNSQTHVFVRDRTMGTTENVSLSSSGTQGNGNSNGASISADGRYVAFSSSADNLVPEDSNKVEDIFVRDRVAGTTQRVSLSASGQEGNLASFGQFGLSISGDGRSVAFESLADNLVPGDTNQLNDLFVAERSLSAP